MSQKTPHVNHKSKQKQAVPQMAAPTSTPPRQARTRSPDGSLSSERPQAFARLSQEERDAMDAAQIPYEASLPQMASAAPDRPSDMDTMLEEASGRSSPKVPAPRMRSKSPGRDRAFQKARNRGLPQMTSLDTLPPPHSPLWSSRRWNARRPRRQKPSPQCHPGRGARDLPFSRSQTRLQSQQEVGLQLTPPPLTTTRHNHPLPLNRLQWRPRRLQRDHSQPR